MAFGLAIFLFLRANKDKHEFYQTTGKITYIGGATGNRLMKDQNKYRHLQVNSHSKTFELFIGKGTGDFKPKLEKLDSLLQDNLITIYYNENSHTKADLINRLVYFIDKGGKPVFIKGSWERILAYVIVGLCAILVGVLLYLKIKGKII